MLHVVLNICKSAHVTNPDPVWGNIKGEPEDCSQGNETSWTLPDTSTASQQTGAMGTNTRASESWTSHPDKRGCSQ